jgi:hypothetical protein
MMSPDITVIFLIWVFYAYECVAWGAKGDTFFRSFSGKSWTIARLPKFLEGAKTSLIFLFPFPPLGMVLPAHLPRIAFSPEGLSNYVDESVDAPVGRSPAHYAYDQIESAGVRGPDVLINGRTFARAHSKAEAGELRDLIVRIKSGRHKDRERLITDRIREQFSGSRITETIDGYVDRTAWLSTLSNALWFFLILVIPASLYVYGFSRIVLAGLVAVLLLHLAVTAIAFLKRRAIYGAPDYSLLGRLLPSPFNSIRSVDLLAKELLAGFHPFAVAAAILPQEAFLRYARARLAWIRHPLYDPDVPERARDTDRWYKDRLREAMTGLIAEKGIDVESLRFPENIDKETGYQAFCPRCLCLYTQQEGTCGDCSDTKLVPVSNHRKKGRSSVHS